jgi:hypothetical protein
VPLVHKDDSWSFPHFDTITVSVADGPRPNEILVAWRLPTADASKTDAGLSRSDDCSQDVGSATGGQVAFALMGRQA